MSYQTNHSAPGGGQPWPFTLAQQEVIAMLPESWQDQVKREGPAATLKDIESKYYLPGITLNSALLGLVAAYHGEDAPVLKRATALLDAQSASSKAEQEQAVENPPYTIVEHQLLAMLPKDWWNRVARSPRALDAMVRVEIPEISGHRNRVARIVALVNIARNNGQGDRAADLAKLNPETRQAVFTAVAQRRALLEEEFGDAVKFMTQPDPATDALTFESFTQALRYFNEQGRKTEVPESTAHLRADQQAWERDSLDYVRPESLAETFNVPERFVGPAQQTWEPAEPATTWSTVPEKAAKPVVQDFACERTHDEPRLVPTREQAMGLGGARVVTNLSKFTTPQGPVVEEDPALFDVPEPREELAEQLRAERNLLGMNFDEAFVWSLSDEERAQLVQALNDTNPVPPPVAEDDFTESMREALAVASPVLQSSVREEGVIGAAERFLGYYRTQQLLAAFGGEKGLKAVLLMELARKNERSLLGYDVTLDEFAELLGVDYTPEPEPEFDMVERLNIAARSARQAAKALNDALAKVEAADAEDV